MVTLPDILEIQPLMKAPDCTITVPGSKSITNRALILAALAKGKCTLRGALWADDTQVMVESLKRLGFEVTVENDPNESCNRTITVVGQGGQIPAKKAELFVGNAGTAARFLTALVALGHGEYRISGDPRMHQRPMADLFVALRGAGAVIESPNDRLPATIIANGLHEGYIDILLTDSTQFASALILIQSQAGFGLRHLNVETQDPGYVAMTEAMCNQFTHSTFQPDYSIEPDMSSASYFVAAEWIKSGKVVISGWPQDSVQVDGKFSQFLQPLLQVSTTPLQVSRIRDLGDSVMTLAICALFGNRPLQIIHASRLRHQECDRISAMITELNRVGAEVKENEDKNGFTVWPAKPDQFGKADIETYNDHRMAMCFAVLGLKVPGIRIKNPGCVSKTFPNFFDKLEQLRQ